MGEVAERAGLRGKAFVNAENFQAQLGGFFVKGIGHFLVVHAKAVAGASWIGVAVPLPRVDAVLFDLAFHLVKEGGEVGLIFNFVPIMIGSAVALAESAGASGNFVELLLGFGHQPAGKNAAAPVTPLKNVAGLVFVDFPAGNAGNHGEAGFAVKENLFDKVGKAVFVGAVLEADSHALEDAVAVSANAEGNAVGKMRLHVEHKVFAFGKLFFRGGGFQSFGFGHVPKRPVNEVAGVKGGGHSHRGFEKIPLGHSKSLGFFGGHLVDAMFPFPLLFVLRAGNVFFVGDGLRRDGRLQPELAVALPFRNPHNLFLGSNFPVTPIILDDARATFVTKKFLPNPKLPGCISLGWFRSAVPLGQIRGKQKIDKTKAKQNKGRNPRRKERQSGGSQRSRFSFPKRWRIPMRRIPPSRIVVIEPESNAPREKQHPPESQSRMPRPRTK